MRGAERLRPHAPFLAVLALGVALRAATMVAYHPALFYSDSWAYLYHAWDHPFVSFAPDRPVGYPLAIRALLLDVHDVTALVGLQHVAGAAVGVLAYVLLVGLGVQRWLAAAAAAVPLLDASTLAIEQHVMPEAFFTLALMAAVLATILGVRGRRGLALGSAGALFAAAASLRAVGLFALPVWIAYLLWRRVGWSLLAIALISALLPLGVYAAVYHARWHHYGLTAANGWFLYGRVAPLARCRDLRLSAPAARLCRATERVPDDPAPGFWLWEPASPANRAFGRIGPTPAAQDRSERVVGELARAIVRDRPIAYAERFAADFGRFFKPGDTSGSLADAAIGFPPAPEAAPPLFKPAERDRLLPGLRLGVRAPAGALRAYHRLVRAPRPLLALLALACLASTAAGAVRRDGRPTRHREAFLLGGMALALLIGSAATSGFVLRYLVPVVPLLACGGAAALADVGPLRRPAWAGGESRPSARAEAESRLA